MPENLGGKVVRFAGGRLPSREQRSEEVVFPNNIKELRVRKGMRQQDLIDRMEEKLSITSVSKIEAGERRLTRVQLNDFANALEVMPDEIPLDPERDAEAAAEWDEVQRGRLTARIQAGWVATGQLITELRTKKGRTLQDLAGALGVSVSIIHRVGRGERSLTLTEEKLVARDLKVSVADFRARRDKIWKAQMAALNRGKLPEEIVPQYSRDFVSGVRGAIGLGDRGVRRSARVMARGGTLPVFGKMERRSGETVFVLDRNDADVERVPAPEWARGEDWFAVRVYSGRMGLLVRPGTLAYVKEGAPVNVGDLVVFVRKGAKADCAVVSGDVMKAMTLRMFMPDEEISMSGSGISAVYRVAGLVFPER